MKLLHKVVKSSRNGGVEISGVVSIDNTVVIKPKPVKVENEDEAQAQEANRLIEERIQTEILNRIASHEREFSEKEKKAFEEIELQKSKIISEAMITAQKMKTDAENECLILKENARKKGYEDGFTEGKNEALESEKKHIDDVVKLLSQINEAKENLYNSYENEILDLAYEIAQKITLSQIKADKSIIFDIVKQALKNFRNSDFVKISLAKCDVDVSVVTDEAFIKKIAGNIKDVEIELLPDAKSGTVILDNDKEIIDASVPTQLDLLQEIMNNSKQ